jgi:hypothetical protein
MGAQILLKTICFFFSFLNFLLSLMKTKKTLEKIKIKAISMQFSMVLLLFCFYFAFFQCFLWFAAVQQTKFINRDQK